MEVNSQLSDTATAVGRGSVLEDKGSGYPQFMPSTPQLCDAETKPWYEEQGLCASLGHGDVDVFFSCSENEDDDTEQGHSTQSRHVLIPSPIHRVYSRWRALSKSQGGCEDL